MKILCIDFVNGEWYKTHEIFKEPLKDEKWILNFNKTWDLNIESCLEEEEQIKTLLDLRTLLSKMIYANCKKEEIDLNDLKILNKYMESYKFKKNIIVENNQYKIINSPVENTGDILIYEIISSFFLLISENKFDRLNFCKNPDCRWIFYDESKNKTRKWCDNTCASLMKVRRYREKQK